ncbi:MAG: adenosylcobinamide-GDP ribazoletransferase [Myxococcota bacterium]
MTRFFAALSFLTRLPAPGAANYGPAEVGRGALCFPLVGAVVGALTVLALLGFGAVLPPWLAAILAVAVMLRATGAFHQDALADFVDGFGGGFTRADVLRIMHDSTIGAYGAVALMLALAIRVGCYAALLDGGRAGIVAAAALARWPSVLLGAAMPYAHADGKALGRALTDHIGAREVLGASVLAVGMGTALLGSQILPQLVWLSLCGSWFARIARRRLQGITGDTMGAATEVCELGSLILLVAL